ncbi:DMT family transporter [Lacibacterium aquatile]|uniref:DMT family transporter n=1 Tax=Lacibacterium aquatile TaxID=1168082 RepID=A0ABW5DWJ4_9PROT
MSVRPTPLWQPVLATVFVYAGFASMDAIAKHLTGRVEPAMILWTRFAVMFLVMSVLWRRDLRRIPPLLRDRMVIFRSLMPLGSGLFAILSLQRLPLFDATALFYTAPLVTVLLAVWFLKERISRTKLIAVLCGFGGMLLIARPGGALFGCTILLPLACALCFAGNQILTRLVRGYDGRQLLLAGALIGLIAASLPLPFLWRTPDLAAFGWMALAGVLMSGVQTLLLWGLQRAEAARLAPIGYLQVVFALFLGLAIFGEVPDVWSIVGMAIIVASTLAGQRR